MHSLWVVALIGLVVGALAKLIMPGKDPGGFIVTMLIGIAASFVATWIGQAIGWYQEGPVGWLCHVSARGAPAPGIYYLVRRRSA
jgi:uncharacterized membrane protein YeaQ/YmgE (transglycosylase-associated protein family)